MEFNNEISDTLLTVGRNVKKYRCERGLTQQELAYLAGRTERCTVSKIERSYCNGINLTTLIKISVVLGIKITDLFNAGI